MCGVAALKRRSNPVQCIHTPSPQSAPRRCDCLQGGEVDHLLRDLKSASIRSNAAIFTTLHKVYVRLGACHCLSLPYRCLSLPFHCRSVPFGAPPPDQRTPRTNMSAAVFCSSWCAELRGHWGHRALAGGGRRWVSPRGPAALSCMNRRWDRRPVKAVVPNSCCCCVWWWWQC